MKKKLCLLAYDLDSSVGLNNEGALVFGYNLEDTDKLEGADVYNGQDSVLWNNLNLLGKFKSVCTLVGRLSCHGNCISAYRNSLICLFGINRSSLETFCMKLKCLSQNEI